MRATLRANAIAIAVLTAIGLSGCYPTPAEVEAPTTSETEDRRAEIAPGPAEHGTYWETTPEGDTVLCAWAGKYSYKAGYGISCDWDHIVPGPEIGPPSE